MTDKELRQLGKADLLAFLREQEAEIAQLKEQVQTLENRLQERRIQLEECGSIAQAAMEINKVAEAAQAAADQYLENIRVREQESAERMKEQEEQAAQKIEAVSAKARENCMRMEQECRENCRNMETESRMKASAYWTMLEERLEKYYESHKGLKELLQSAGIQVQIPNPTEGTDKEA